MIVYEPLVMTGYEWVNCINAEQYEVFTNFDGELKGAGWKPIKVRRVRADNSQDMKESDFPWLGSDAMVMRRSAVDKLRDILEQDGEILILSTDDKIDLFVLNARVVNALDEQRSEVVRYPGTDRIMMLKKPVFNYEKIKGVNVFRLLHRASSTYVTDRFVERVKEAGLRGLTFKKVWSSDK